MTKVFLKLLFVAAGFFILSFFPPEKIAIFSRIIGFGAIAAALILVILKKRKRHK